MAKSEVFASHLLNAVGAHTAEMKLVDLGSKHRGGLGVASRWLDSVQPFNARDDAHVNSMQQTFAAHAWLANWDSVGLTQDNVLFHQGRAVHIDPGGALEYRAMGGKKGDAFADKVGELETMRNPDVNRASAAVYGAMTTKDVVRSAKAVLGLPAATITKLVGRHGPGSPAHRMALAAKLIERQQYIKRWCVAAQPDLSKFRNTEHALKALNKAFPAYKGNPSGTRVKNVAKFVELGTFGEPPWPLDVPHRTHDTSVYAAQTLVGLAKLPAAQREAVHSYTYFGFEEINASLRAGKPSAIAKAADAAIRNAGSEIAYGTLLSRKINVEEPFMEQLLNATGKVLQEPALMSTSTRPDLYTGNVHLKLTVGHGVKGLFLGGGSAPGNGSISKIPNESEIVLPANTRLYIHEVTEATHRGDKDGFGSQESGITHIVHAMVLPTR
ncbi:ADP-ribosyltransferase [Collimonas silvisoli]|uniref:ADP-ribosyltransferase n=1 Tax=Collimonas silvisoli TaxID=2825884 RepID=UPI001B8AFF84|nr:ADP-ribosyltransferase [Collimonas silvisoli]